MSLAGLSGTPIASWDSNPLRLTPRILVAGALLAGAAGAQDSSLPVGSRQSADPVVYLRIRKTVTAPVQHGELGLPLLGKELSG